jgi:transglutaminase-like putative cysteine protease
LEIILVLLGLFGSIAFLATIWYLIRWIIRMADRKPIFRKRFFISIIVFMIGFVGVGIPDKFVVASEISEVKLKRWAILSERDGKNEKATYRGLISKQAIQLVTGLKSDREKALAIASWIAANWRNASENTAVHNSHNSKSMLAKFINRTGACGTRTSIFVDMAKAAGLKVGRYSIYNFGRVGAGHTAAAPH